jgi:quercetin dioxygenase-like cupin family protein
MSPVRNIPAHLDVLEPIQMIVRSRTNRNLPCASISSSVVQSFYGSQASMLRSDQIDSVQIVLPCPVLDPTLRFFTEQLGFRVEAIFPADSPAVAVVNGYGTRLRLDSETSGSPGTLRLLCRDPKALADTTELIAPNGTRIQLVAVDPPLVMPPLTPAFVVSRMGDGPSWGAGRAGMLYRDLIPDRQGGRFIASHIRIPEGGPVPDYVHFHKVAFQMIYCRKGWVHVVYEDQGPSFVMHAGDCVLQPPRIRHRVLESSAGLEVIEISCPAEHETAGDLLMTLPTDTLRPDRVFGGQRFVRHVAKDATWQPWRLDGFEARDTGIAAATTGIASAKVVRPRGAPPAEMRSHEADLVFMFVLEGALTLRREGGAVDKLSAGDSFVVPARMPHALTGCSTDLELLEVTLPAVFASARHPGAEVPA